MGMSKRISRDSKQDNAPFQSIYQLIIICSRIISVSLVQFFEIAPRGSHFRTMTMMAINDNDEAEAEAEADLEPKDSHLLALEGLKSHSK